ncbi:MAG: DEAD/DEAH box helicase [Flavobacterium sp.]|jgi:ATP-dependent RNA helicase RhlE
MELKKINPFLQKALIEHDLAVANEMQEATFSTLKSGADAVIQSPEQTGKTTTLVLNVIQKLKEPFEESPRALILVTDKAKGVEMKEMFDKLGTYNQLRVYMVHDKSDLDYDKNQISMGIDVLIGTPDRLNLMFSGAGYNVNKLSLIAFDDFDVLLRNRFEAVILRLSDSILKGQRIAFCSQITEKVEILSDRIMNEPIFFEA